MTQYILSIHNEKAIQKKKQREKRPAQLKETPLQNMGPVTISQQAGIDHTHVPPLGIWPQTNIVKQNIHKTSCSPNQHAQIQYYNHTKTNICANERKYCNRPFTDTYKQKKHRKHTAHNKGQQTTSYSHTRTQTNTFKHLNCRLNTKYSAKNRKHTEHMPLKPHT